VNKVFNFGGIVDLDRAGMCSLYILWQKLERSK